MNLPNTMKAVRVYGVRDYRLEEVPVPTPGPGEVLVKVLASGVCASDVKTYLGARVWGSAEIAPYIQTPVTPGHEFVGEVVALGEGAAEKYGLQVGDWAVSEQIVPCWQCRFCQRGQYWMCQRHDIYGFIKDRAEGSWAEYMRFPANAINHKVPKEIPAEQAALIEPMACAIHAVERGNIQLGDTVVIAGMGPIGLGMVAVARRKSPGLLIALDMKPHRLQLALEMGADLAIDVSQGDAIQRVLDLTDGYGCDVYIEATGAGPAVGQGLQ
ncbi:MAG: alcohol dehydrogenase catalytic domain-containing protein, partial [Chloroflexi bacterium]|nr:alcohol dehydrogenase catalytic domain-containing protein [Chloroflexota bacterium]